MKSILSKYILSAFMSQFAVIFITVTSVFSVATLIRLADLTRIAEVDLADMLTLFLLSCPQIVFYCLPLAIFAASTSALAQLSTDREITAFFALGARKQEIVKPLFFVALIGAIFLLFIGLWLVPSANTEARNLIEVKKAQVNVAIHPGESAQRFGEWLAFTPLKENGELKDITLFSAKNEEAKLVFADTAYLEPTPEGVKLTLKKGIGYNIDSNKSVVSKIEFDELAIKQRPPSGVYEAGDVIKYWLADDPKRKKDFANNVLAALFPLASLFFIATIGLFHPRFRKNNSAVLIIAAGGAYYVLLLTLSPILLLWAIIATLGIWTTLGYALMKKTSIF